jgi:hypothetical protein
VRRMMVLLTFMVVMGAFVSPAAQGGDDHPSAPRQFPGDGDGDSVPDQYDKCPTVAGSQDAQGCPDRDGDWVADADDACPDLAGAEEGGGDGCPDKDGDGVYDSEDACNDRQSRESVGPNGCPPVIGSIGLPWRSLSQMAESGVGSATCKYTAQAPCRFSVLLKLSKASAAALGVKRATLVDETFTTTRSSKRFFAESGTWKWRPSGALRAKLKKAKSVTFTYTAGFTYGDGTRVKLPVGTFVLKQREDDGYPPSVSSDGKVVGPGNKMPSGTNEAGEQF